MQCMSCQAEINPKWKHAIQNNICPFCGELIMSEALKDSLASLHEILTNLEPYSQQLEDWLLSNFNFIRTTSPLIVNYVPEEYLKKQKKAEPVDAQKTIIKVKTEKGEEDVVSEKIQSEERTNSFFKRADAIKPKLDGFNSPAEKTEKLKSMVEQIKNGSMQTALLDEDGNIIEQTESTSANSAQIAQLQSVLEGEDNVYSSIQNEDSDDVPDVVKMMASKAAGNQMNADLLKLKQLQERNAQSRKNFQNGTGGKGSFSRV